MTKNALVPAGKSSALYAQMQTAIARCYSVDEYKEVAAHATAIAAYYKQIHDDESVRKFLQIKIRAWRRIGEILISAKIDKATCTTRRDTGRNLSGTFNMAEYIRKTKVFFKHDKSVEQLSDTAFRQAIAIAEVPEEFFTKNITKCTSIDHLLSEYALLQRREWEATPEGQAQKAAIESSVKEQRAENTRVEKQREEEKAEEQAELDLLRKAQAEAFNEVGITLERHDRKRMAQVVFLIKRELHDVLRQAAFDNHMTMQALLRSGLAMWLFAHGYKVSVEDMQPSKREKVPSNAKTKAQR